MPLHDFRTKPDTEWTFYVVDHLPTMDNIYRYDSAQEAIQKYSELPDNLRCAIGSSLNSRFEIDHIHKIDGNAVLIRDMYCTTNSVWRDSPEVNAAVALMKEQLRVRYELDSTLFGYDRGSVAIPLSEHAGPNNYFNNKHLDPKVPDRPLSGINEVYVEGSGWVDILSFLDNQENRTWSRESGYPVPFVNTLNIRYADSHDYQGQADVTPAEYKVLRDEYVKARERKPDLDAQISNAEAKAAGNIMAGKEKDTPAKGR